MFCPKCGKEVEERGIFCTECGTRLDSPSQADLGADTATRVCEWCKESIPQHALKCPHCQKWRKDIDRERVLYYFWAGASILPILLFFVGLREEWWHRTKVVDSGFIKVLPVGSEFSIMAFLTSFSGFVVLAGFVITCYLCCRYYVRVSRKIGSWWWF